MMSIQANTLVSVKPSIKGKPTSREKFDKLLTSLVNTKHDIKEMALILDILLVTLI